MTKPRHYQTKTKLYRLWSNIKGRCYRKSHENYPRYGGAGITLYKTWAQSFLAFKAYIELNLGLENADLLSLDRIDSGLGYQPGNIRWASKAVQVHNKKPRQGKKYKGVFQSTKYKKFKAQICVNRKTKYLGYFETPEEAAHAYNEAAKKYYGVFASLNKIK